MRFQFGPIFCVCLLSLCRFTGAEEPDLPNLLIGYNEHRTNLPGGRYANVITNRAMLVQADGMHRRRLAAELADVAGSWTQFAGWSPDGRMAVVGRGWESIENAAWEEEHKTFRFNPEGWLYDSYLVDVATGTAENVTAVDRVSFYNTGLFFWQNDSTKLGFTALIDGNSKPFRMDRDGRNKVDLTKDSNGFAYGFSSSPDGSRISYHENYQVYLADADGANRVHVQTGHPFVFAPSWSPDGKSLLFVSGEHYNCHPHIVRADGTGLRKLADRGGYRGVIEFLDVPDYHGGSSDVPVWSSDNQSVFYTAKVGANVELFQIMLDGQPEQLTHSAEGSQHYHPKPSPDGKWIVFGSKRNGVRNLFLMRLSDRKEHALTDLPTGHAAMHAYWQPQVVQAAEIPAWQSARELHPGIRLIQVSVSEPRRMQIHAVKIDLTTPNLALYTTPRAEQWVESKTETVRQTTRDFLRSSQATERQVMFAANADSFSPWPAPFSERSATNLSGLAISEGVVVSPPSGSPSLLITKSGEASIQATTDETPLINIQTAISGFALCLSDHVVQPSGKDLHPRTGLGLSADEKSLFVLAIDGRRYSRQGATTQELGEWLKKFGADDGINMDGGGSTTLAWWNPQAGDDARCELINAPVGSGVKFESEVADRQYVPTERANGNNFGVYYQQVP